MESFLQERELSVLDFDKDDLRGRESGSDEEDRNTSVALTPGDSLIAPPIMRRIGNTGVKGVINDYLDTKKEMVQQQREREARVKALIAEQSVTCASTLEQEELDDEEFFAAYKAKRMAELRNQAFGPRFGHYVQIGQQEYVDAVDKEHKGVYVIVHLYKDSIEECRQLNKYL